MAGSLVVQANDYLAARTGCAFYAGRRDTGFPAQPDGDVLLPVPSCGEFTLRLTGRAALVLCFVRFKVQ
jgi:hypothetical protein